MSDAPISIAFRGWQGQRLLSPKASYPPLRPHLPHGARWIGEDAADGSLKAAIRGLHSFLSVHNDGSCLGGTAPRIGLIHIRLPTARKCSSPCRKDLPNIRMLASSSEVAHFAQPVGILDVMKDHA